MRPYLSEVSISSLTINLEMLSRLLRSTAAGSRAETVTRGSSRRYIAHVPLQTLGAVRRGVLTQHAEHHGGRVVGGGRGEGRGQDGVVGRVQRRVQVHVLAQLLEAQPLAVHGDAEVAKVDGVLSPRAAHHVLLQLLQLMALHRQHAGGPLHLLRLLNLHAAAPLRPGLLQSRLQLQRLSRGQLRQRHARCTSPTKTVQKGTSR